MPPAPELYTALAELGHELRFTEYIRTRMPLPDQAQSLRLPEGVPLLHIIRVTLTAAEKPLALEEFRLPGNDLGPPSGCSRSPVGSDFLYLIKPRLRSAPPGALPAPLRAPLLPSARSARAAPTRAHMWIGPMAMS
ncbi:UTRA domain-containing protein [Streptomyces sp. f51]|uniref:UTRA domain-containing protein n=1 Tax=Streptomyces sp. f51 TaxID=1827742 RepID=UPI0030CED457